MNHKIKNFFTFGVYDRLVKAECEVIKLKESIASIDVDSQVEDEINRRNVLTEDNFSPSDYDLVSSDDYDFDYFMNESDVRNDIDNAIDSFDVTDKIDEAISEVTESMVKKVCTEMLIDWCERTAKAADNQVDKESTNES